MAAERASLSRFRCLPATTCWCSWTTAGDRIRDRRLGDPRAARSVRRAPGAGHAPITLLRRTEGIRETEFVDGGPFRAAAINAELDRIMLLIQEDRDEHSRALRARPVEGELDFCLPPAAERASKVLLGFDSAGQPDGVRPERAADQRRRQRRSWSPRPARPPRVRSASISRHWSTFATSARSATASPTTAPRLRPRSSRRRAGLALVYVPASATPTCSAPPSCSTASTMIGDGAGCTLKLGLPSGAGVQLAGSGAAPVGLRVLGPGASSLAGSACGGRPGRRRAGRRSDRKRAPGRDAARVEVAGCATALAIEGRRAGDRRLRVLVQSSTASRSVPAPRARSSSHAPGSMRAPPASAPMAARVVRSARRARRRACRLAATASTWSPRQRPGVRSRCRTSSYAGNLKADVEAGPRQSLALRGGRLDASGKRNGAAVELHALGETELAPNLIAENVSRRLSLVASVQLSGGTNLEPAGAGRSDRAGERCRRRRRPLDQPSRRPARGVVHKVDAARLRAPPTIELASATILPLVQAGDVIRVVGRSGTATVDSVGAQRARRDLHLAARRRSLPGLRRPQSDAGRPDRAASGRNADLRHLPGPRRRAGRDLRASSCNHGAVNGALAATVHASDRPEHSSKLHAARDHRHGPGVRAKPRARRSDRCDLLLPGGCARLHRAVAKGVTSLSDVEVRPAARRSPAPPAMPAGSPSPLTRTARSTSRTAGPGRRIRWPSM